MTTETKRDPCLWQAGFCRICGSLRQGIQGETFEATADGFSGEAG
jgi:hypothetical protein